MDVVSAVTSGPSAPTSAKDLLYQASVPSAQTLQTDLVALNEQLELVTRGIASAASIKKSGVRAQQALTNTLNTIFSRTFRAPFPNALVVDPKSPALLRLTDAHWIVRPQIFSVRHDTAAHLIRHFAELARHILEVETSLEPNQRLIAAYYTRYYEYYGFREEGREVLRVLRRGFTTLALAGMQFPHEKIAIERILTLRNYQARIKGGFDGNSAQRERAIKALSEDRLAPGELQRLAQICKCAPEEISSALYAPTDLRLHRGVPIRRLSSDFTYTLPIWPQEKFIDVANTAIGHCRTYLGFLTALDAHLQTIASSGRDPVRLTSSERRKIARHVGILSPDIDAITFGMLHTPYYAMTPKVPSLLELRSTTLEYQSEIKNLVKGSGISQARLPLVRAEIALLKTSTAQHISILKAAMEHLPMVRADGWREALQRVFKCTAQETDTLLRETVLLPRESDVKFFAREGRMSEEQGLLIASRWPAALRYLRADSLIHTARLKHLLRFCHPDEILADLDYRKHESVSAPRSLLTRYLARRRSDLAERNDAAPRFDKRLPEFDGACRGFEYVSKLFAHEDGFTYVRSLVAAFPLAVRIKAFQQLYHTVHSTFLHNQRLSDISGESHDLRLVGTRALVTWREILKDDRASAIATKLLSEHLLSVSWDFGRMLDRDDALWGQLDPFRATVERSLEEKAQKLSADCEEMGSCYCLAAHPFIQESTVYEPLVRAAQGEVARKVRHLVFVNPAQIASNQRDFTLSAAFTLIRERGDLESIAAFLVEEYVRESSPTPPFLDEYAFLVASELIPRTGTLHQLIKCVWDRDSAERSNAMTRWASLFKLAHFNAQEFADLVLPGDAEVTKFIARPNTNAELRDPLIKAIGRARVQRALSALPDLDPRALSLKDQEVREAIGGLDLREQRFLLARRAYYDYCDGETKRGAHTLTNLFIETEKIRNFYSILGVPRNATLSQIETSKLIILRVFHSDNFQLVENQARAQKTVAAANEAYETLSDITKRAAYDRRLDMAGFPVQSHFFPRTIWFGSLIARRLFSIKEVDEPASDAPPSPFTSAARILQLEFPSADEV